MLVGADTEAKEALQHAVCPHAHCVVEISGSVPGLQQYTSEQPTAPSDETRNLNLSRVRLGAHGPN